jgi:hypothetical protein
MNIMASQGPWWIIVFYHPDLSRRMIGLNTLEECLIELSNYIMLNNPQV